MSGEESSSSSSSSAGEQTECPLTPSSSSPESLEKDEVSHDKGNKPSAFGNDEERSNPSISANVNTIKNSKTKKKKRKRRSKSEDEWETLELQKERYDRLLYTARKQLHKTAKQIKTFLLQKEIRKRSSKANDKKGGENVAATTTLDAKKSLDLEVVTSQAIRQLGLYHCDPRFKMVTEEATAEDETNPGKEENGNNGNKSKKGLKQKNRQDDNTPAVIPAPLAPDDPQKTLVDTVLTHKRFSKSLEEWNEKITEYRRWCMNIEQRNNPNPFGIDDDFVASKRSKKNKKKQGNTATAIADEGLQATVENESSLFCTLGGGVPNDSNVTDDFNKYSKYGPASDLGEMPKRKNRQGQRQRRAKAMAIEAKKKGRSREYHQSSNWREPKPKEGYDDMENRSDSGHYKSRGRGKETNRNQRIEQQQQNQHRNYSSAHDPNQQQQQQKVNNQTEEQQHPSWAAKQAQSTGIVAFKGKKITFWNNSCNPSSPRVHIDKNHADAVS